jgi:hypothetical protein
MGCAYRFLAFRPGQRRVPASAPRRAVDRVPVAIPCDVTTADGVIAGYCIEVSLQGASIDTHPTPAPGTVVSVVLHPRGTTRAVRITHAVVRWSRLGRFGVKFESMSPEDAERLREVVLAARGYSPELLTAPPRRAPSGTPWIVVTVVAAAILLTLLLSLRY